MKTPRNLQEFFENPTEDQKVRLAALRLAIMKMQDRQPKSTKKKNPFERN